MNEAIPIGAYSNSRRNWIFPQLMNALYTANRDVVGLNVMFTLLESAIKISNPIVLGHLLHALQNSDVSDPTAYLFALLLGVMNMSQTFLHGVSFFFAYRMGLAWKTSTIALIFDKLFRVNLETFTSGTGKLVNLISNDVGRFDEWGVFSVFFWETYLEVTAIFLILVFTIGIYPALAALGSTFLLIPFQVWLFLFLMLNLICR